MTRRTHFGRIVAAADAVWPASEHRLVLLTGQSDLRSSRLSSAQIDFLTSLRDLPIEVTRAAFPFDDAPATNRPVGLIEACLQNARQYLWARHDPAYGRAAAQALGPVLASASRGILLVTGSCGLQILEAAWPHLARVAGQRMEILALAPVGRRPRFGEAGFSAVQGSADIWGRLLYRGPVTHQSGCGHMDYWSDAVARNALRSAAERLLAGAR